MKTPRSLHPWLGAACLALLFALAPAGARADDLKDGRAALQAGRLDAAQASFERAATQGLAEGRAGVGLVWLKRHQYAKAMEAFQLAEKMDKNLGLAYYGQGEVLRQQEKCDQAVPLLQRAVDLDRKFPEAQLALSNCLTKLKRFDEARAAANRGLGWGSKWRPKFLIALGDVAAERDSLRDAGIWYESAVQESPEDASTHRALGDFYVRRGTFELAYPEYQLAVSKDSSDLDLHFALGRALFYGQRYDAALEEYRTVVARAPEYAAAQFALGDLLYRAGKADKRRYAEAKAPLESYVKLEPNDAKGWSVLGRTYYFLDEKDKALDAMNKAEALGDKTKELYNIRARLWTERKEMDKARADFERGGGEHMAPDDMLRMAVSLVSSEPVRAESLYWTLVLTDSTHWTSKVAMTELGKMSFRAKDYPTTIQRMQRRIGLDPKADEAYYYIGLSYKEMKQYPEAVEALRKAASEGGANRPERHFWLGILLQQTKADAEAQQEFQKAVDLDSTCTANKALALRQLGFFKLAAKEAAAAVPLLEQSTTCNEKDYQTWVWLGQARQNSGNRNNAIAAYKKALELKPGQPEASNGLKQLQAAP